MSILETDIKLMASERLTDYADGGGEMTGSEIVDGQINNLFPDISDDDRVGGRLNLRKAFPAVMTDTVDMYYGAQVIVTKEPGDGNVHVTAFTRNDFYDERANAQDYIESYVVMAQELMLRPMNDQLEGQRAINCFQRVGNQLPEIGETIIIRSVSTGEQQYVRITDISSTKQTFVHETYGQFSVDVVTIGLSAALQYTFDGIAPTPYTTKADARIHATVVADAADFYGVSQLDDAASAGDLTIRVDSIYNQLVPTAQQETALVDQLMGGDNAVMIASGAADSLLWSGARSSSSNVIHLPSGFLPGSLQITIDGIEFVDNGNGDLAAVGDDGGYGGYCDYASGQITIERSTSWSATVTISATPAVLVSTAFVSSEIEIELANRSYNYTPNLNTPLPAPGSVRVAYMAQGKWYELRDNGRGVFVGSEDGTGTGTINYASGSCVITLGALPDVGTSIIIQWGHSVEYNDRSGTVDGDPVQIRHSLPHQGVQPGSITITWLDGETEKTITDTGTGGLTGDGTGVVSYSAGELLFAPTTIPESGTEYSVAYQQEEPTGVIITPTVSDTILSLTIPNAPLRPGSVRVSYQVEQTKTVYADGTVETVTLTVDIDDSGDGYLYRAGVQVGTINYTTGEVSWTGLSTYIASVYKHLIASFLPSGGPVHFGAGYDDVEYTQTLKGSVTVSYAEDVAATWLPQTDSIATPDLEIDLCPTSVEQLVAGSVQFEMDGYTYYDDGAGNLYRDKSSTTGVGTVSGSVNYSTGIATLSVYPSISDNTITLNSLLTSDGGFTPSSYVFRTPGTPVRDGSMSLRATLPAGTLLTAIAGTDGTISDTGIEGRIDTSNGVVRLDFGSMVTASGNENEPWYDASLVEDGMIWKPTGVLPNTALYNCVIYSTLPLDADLLGIEPVRLPSDGRVPIFKTGYVVVVHHTDDELMPNPPAAGEVVTLSRGALSRCKLVDQDGVNVDETLYTVDLDNGTVTFADPLDLSAYTQPLVAAHRIEDMGMLSDVQINGYITMVSPLTHDFPANETQVSSALRFGDLAARVVRAFTQKTWDGVWRDSRSGDDTTAKYDDTNYPFVLTNKGSIAQRWCIKFTSSTTFDVISEKRGVIASGNTSSDCSPINPATGVPYFSIDYRGWGAGWATGNCLFHQTSAANVPLWLARAIMLGQVGQKDDEFIIQIRGNAN